MLRTIKAFVHALAPSTAPLLLLLLLPIGQVTAQPAGEAIERRVDGRIVGGEATTISEHPHQVAITRKSRLAAGNNNVWCGGTIVAQRWVLTAAHCLFASDGQRIPDSDFVVKIGATHLVNDSTWRPIERAVVHDCYKEQSGKDPYDIAMMRLSINAAASRIIALASPSTPVPPTTDVVVTGWGKIVQGGPSSAELREVTVKVVSKATCTADKQSYEPYVTDTMICAGLAEGGKDSCNGDSGGPMVLDRNGSKILVGVVSWGQGCAQQQWYGVYTRVGSYRPWISKVMSGAAPACQPSASAPPG